MVLGNSKSCTFGLLENICLPDFSTPLHSFMGPNTRDQNSEQGKWMIVCDVSPHLLGAGVFCQRWFNDVGNEVEAGCIEYCQWQKERPQLWGHEVCKCIWPIYPTLNNVGAFCYEGVQACWGRVVWWHITFLAKRTNILFVELVPFPWMLDKGPIMLDLHHLNTCTIHGTLSGWMFIGHALTKMPPKWRNERWPSIGQQFELGVGNVPFF